MGRIREDTVLSCPFMGNPLTCRKPTATLFLLDVFVGGVYPLFHHGAY